MAFVLAETICEKSKSPPFAFTSSVNSKSALLYRPPISPLSRRKPPSLKVSHLMKNENRKPEPPKGLQKPARGCGLLTVAV